MLRPELLLNDPLSLQGSRWKAVRSVMSTSFSNSKMRKMMPLISGKVEELMKRLTDKCKDGAITLDISRDFDCFSVETIALCAYGTRIDDKNMSTFLENNKKFFKAFKEPYRPLTFAMIMPWIEPILRWFGCYMHPIESVNFFRDTVIDMMGVRQSDPEPKEYVDFLQLMMNASKTHKNDGVSEVAKVNKRALTDDEIIAGCISFFSANNDTMKAGLCFAIYFLTVHPDVQERLIAEIDDVTAGCTNIISKGIIKQLTYMDMVVRETLRLYPPAIKFDRLCKNDCVINGYHIHRGVTVDIATWVVHRDPDIWPEPETFNPERFSPENRSKIHPMAWLPFGAGPRKCIGDRFAMMEISMVLTRILQKFRFERCPETEVPPAIGKGGLIAPLNGITVRVVPRS